MILGTNSTLQARQHISQGLDSPQVNPYESLKQTRHLFSIMFDPSGHAREKVNFLYDFFVTDSEVRNARAR